MLRMVLNIGELLLMVFTETLFHGPTLWHGSKCRHFGGIAANLEETLVGFVLLCCLFLFLPSKSAGRGGECRCYELLLLIVALKCHIQYQFLNMILVKCRRERKEKVFTFLIH